MEFVTLNNSIRMPILGLGVYRVDEAAAERAVTDALEVGYRLIDTASLYQNEEAVGRAVAASGIPREELFVTSKLWLSDAGYDKTKAAFQTSLDKLGLDYLDLYLIHQPYGDAYGSWRAMRELYQEGRIKAIGVSNFPLDRVVDLSIFTEVTPAINQIEIHPFSQQTKTVEYLLGEGVQPEAYSPLAAGRNGIFEQPVLAGIAAKHGRSVAQIVLRWLIQRGIVTIAKSTNPARIAENLTVFDFTLDDADLAAIAGIDTGKSVYYDATDPEVVKQFRDFA